MEIGETPVSLPSITRINNEITYVVKNVIKQYLSTVIDSISDEYQIPRDELYRKYLTDEMLAIYCGATDVKRKREKQSISNNEDLCHAKTGNSTRCSRKHKEDGKYCGPHMTNRRFGDYVEETHPRTGSNGTRGNNGGNGNDGGDGRIKVVVRKRPPSENE